MVPDHLSSSPNSSSIKVVVFKLIIGEVNKKSDYAVKIEQVQEICVAGSITRVPGSPSYIRGVMNLRGKIITIIDIKEKLGFEAISSDKIQSAKILVAQVGTRLIGILVDEVDQVLEIPREELETSSKVMPVSTNDKSWIAKHGDRLIILLELNEIFSPVQGAAPNKTSCSSADRLPSFSGAAVST